MKVCSCKVINCSLADSLEFLEALQELSLKVYLGSKVIINQFKMSNLCFVESERTEILMFHGRGLLC